MTDTTHRIVAIDRFETTRHTTTVARDGSKGEDLRPTLTACRFVVHCACGTDTTHDTIGAATAAHTEHVRYAQRESQAGVTA